ncbi:MAG: uracil-xanthine permease family protein, partial [Pseudomonas paracarnis]
MSDAQAPRPRYKSDLMYGLEDRPHFTAAIFAALQHVLASFVGIITPTLIVGGVLGLESEVPYLVSMALFVSGLGTFVQARTFGPVGSGLLCLQGTSFSFISVILSAGFMVKARGGGTDEILSTIFGICFFAAFIEVVLSQFIGKLRKLITPVVTGTIITLMGLSLIKVAVTDMAGGYGASDLGAAGNMGLAALVLLTIVVLNRFNNPFLRLGSIVIGLTLGFVVAWLLGRVDMAALPQVPLISVPVPFKYGFSFDWVAFIPVAVIFLISPLEAAGDLTANSM